MKQNTWFKLSFLIILLFISSACSATAQEPEQTSTERPPVPVEIIQIETGNIASVLSYSGDLRPVQSLPLVSIVSGAVEEVLVEVGDEVRAGDPILRVEDTAYRAQLKQAEAGLTVAQVNLQKMRKGPREEQIELAKTGLAVAEANLQKMQQGAREEQIALAQAGLDAARAQLTSVSTLTEDERTLASANLAQAEAGLRLAQYEYDKIKWAGQVGQTPQALQLQQATIAYETALAAYNVQANPDESTLDQIRAAVRQAELNLALTANPFTQEDLTIVESGVRQAQLNLSMTEDPFSDEDFALARANVAQAEAIVSQAQYQVDNVILRAPFDGVIAEVYATTGSVASPQSPAIKLISKDLEVLIDVPSGEIAQVYEDQPAALRTPSYRGQDFPALVTNVAPAADTSSHTFPVTIVPLDEEAKLRAGMFAEIAILTQEKVNAVLVPRSAVTVVGGQEVVYVVSEDQQTVTLRPIVSGLSDETRIEVVEGILPGETIILAGLSNLSDGAKIEIVGKAE